MQNVTVQNVTVQNVEGIVVRGWAMEVSKCQIVEKLVAHFKYCGFVLK